MLKTLVSLEHEVEGKIYTMICVNDSPIVHVKEALFKFLGHCESIEEAAKKVKSELEIEKDPVSAQEPEVENVQECSAV